MQWGAIQNAARIITLLLDNSGESHRKCPRCRGSGLLENSFTRLEKGAHPNQPCWFCEGIGALPIAGLNGFVLARTTTCLKSLDKHNQPHVDVLQQNHSRYGKNMSKFTNGKLGVNLADLFYDFSTLPWLDCGRLCCQQNMLEASKAEETILLPHVSEPRLRSCFPHKNLFLRNGFFQRISITPLVLSIVNGSQPKATLSHAASSVPSLQPIGGFVLVNQKAAKIRLVQKVRGGFTMQHAAYRQKTFDCSRFTIDNVHLESDFLGPFIKKLQTQSVASVLSTKRQRLLQKARNCIGDKARKEAQQRARGVVRKLKHKDEAGSTNSHIPECAEMTSKGLQGLGAHGNQSFPSAMASRVAWLTTVAVVARQVLLSQVIANGFQNLKPTTANTMR